MPGQTGSGTQEGEMASRPKRGSERPRRSPTELQVAAHHVTYEIGMLFFSAEDLGGWHASPLAPPEDMAKNMALECFLLHFRNLRAFLCPSIQASSVDDIIAGDFLNELEARDIGEAEVLSNDKKRLDRMLAHLSYSRKEYIEAKSYGWLTAEMELALLDQLEVFFGRLSPERREWFPPADQLSQERRRAEDDKAAVRRYQTTTSVVSIGGSTPPHKT